MPAAMWVLLAALLAAPPPGSDSLPDLLTRAQQLLEAGDRTGARRELTLARKSYPGSPIVSNFLGVLAAEEGDERAAEALFREALQGAPRYTDASLNLGRLYQQAAGKDQAAVDKALAVYQAILAYEPGHAEARYQSAVLRQARGEFARALADLDLLSPVDRERPGALAVRCAALVGKGDRAGADAAADRLLGRSDVSEPDVQMLLPTLAAHGRDDLALRLVDALRARSGVSPDLVLQQARLQEGQDRLDLARKTLEEVAVSRPDSVDLLLDLARVAHKQKDYREALGYLAHARDVAPGNARIHFFFGLVCVDLELGAEAYTSLKEAVRLSPDNPAFNYALGAAALHRRDPSEAVPFFRRYAQLRPDDPRGGFALGIAAFQARDFPTARAQLVPAAQRPETRAAASHFLARMAREENDLEEAVRLSESAVEANPAYADAWAELGLTRFRRRELAQAEAALRKCLELEHDSYLGNLHLLMLYERTKDPRHDEQERRFEAIKVQREEKADDFRRVIEVRPY